MNPDTRPENQFNLPPPAPEALLAPPSEALLPSVEHMPAPSPEAAGNQAHPAPVLPLPADDQQAALAQIQAVQPPLAMAQMPAQAQPAASAKGDDLAKIWVQKAKQIVLQTAADPYEQNRQLAAVKADYLHKQYGKVIKVAE